MRPPRPARLRLLWRPDERRLHGLGDPEIRDEAVAERIGLHRDRDPVVREPDVARGVDLHAGVSLEAADPVTLVARERRPGRALRARARSGAAQVREALATEVRDPDVVV